MKARALKTAVAFYLQSRRRLGFALESEGALLENLVRHARQLRHRGPLTNRLALNWAQVPPPANPRRRARRLEAVRHFARFWVAFDSRTQIPPAGLFGSAYGGRGPVHIYTPKRSPPCWRPRNDSPRLHDLRHPFAVECLLGLVSSGPGRTQRQDPLLGGLSGPSQHPPYLLVFECRAGVAGLGQRALGQGFGPTERSGL